MTEPTPHAQKKKHSRQMATSCESCGNFVYDEDYECYTCEVDLDEDEMAFFCKDKFTTVRTTSSATSIGLCGNRCRQAMRPVYKAAAFAIKQKINRRIFTMNNEV